MKHQKWISKIAITFIACAVLNTHAYYGYNTVNCELDKDCTFSSYNDMIYIPTAKKSDYKCHVTQKNNVCKDGVRTVINSLIGGDSKSYPVQTIDLGGDAGNDTNVYFPARVISENASLHFFVEEKGHCLVGKIADITIHCTMI